MKAKMSKISRTQVPTGALKKAADRAAAKAKKQVQSALKEAQHVVQQRFHQFADANLGTVNAEIYKAGVLVSVGSDPEIDLTVELVGPLPNALEHGYNAFDIKPGLLASGAVKTSKSGEQYVDVPLGLAASAVPSSIKGLLTKAEKQADGMNKRFGVGKADRERMAQTTEFSVKGVFRQAGEHKTIRRVSTKSSPESWIHPGFKGIHAAETLKSEIYTIVMGLVRSFMRSNRQ